MGCDIYLHIEIKVGGQWHHYSAPNVPRNYALFALMADVRNDGEYEPVSTQKGLPDDLSPVTRYSAEHWKNGSRSHSWLSWNEVRELYRRWDALLPSTGDEEADRRARWERDLDTHYFGCLEIYSWADDRPAWVEDVRFVFWFDG